MSKAKFFNGNVKVGKMLTFNKLAGNTKWNGCTGTCGEHCGGCYNPENPKESDCYVIKSYIQYKDAVIGPHVDNTIAMREHMSEAFDDLDRKLSRKRVIVPVRIHSSGEFETTGEIEGWINLARKHPDTPFYVYTKAYDLVDKVLTKDSKLPKNFFINYSIWHEHGIKEYNKWKKLDNVRAFVYDDGKYNYKQAGLNINCRCPAYNEKGKLDHNYTCDKCKICYQKKAKVCSCSSH